MMQKFVYERIREAFTEYVPTDLEEKYQAFLDRYPADQRKNLHLLYCAEVDGLILKMIRVPKELRKIVFAEASDLMQCLAASRYTAVLNYFRDSRAKALSKEFGPNEIMAAGLLSIWPSLRDVNHLDEWNGGPESVS
jgi:hypothetical protein